MLDFIKFVTKYKNGVNEFYPSFKVIKSKDLMIRGNSFYAIWDEDNNKWTTDEFEAIALVDKYTMLESEKQTSNVVPQLLVHSDNGMIDKWHKFCKQQAIDNYVALDETLIFSNMKTDRKSYSSKGLPYPLEKGDYSAWDRLLSVLYSEEERHKIEWAIGSIVSGDSKKIQKFLVFYGSAGTGKSTILNIVQQLFAGYYSVFDAKSLGSSNNSFALEAFKSNPLVAIQHDGDLSKIEDNTKLNSLVSHELMTINEKFKSQYTNSFKAFLMMGTNKPVKITDAKSGLIRRLIDVTPTGNKLSPKEYNDIMNAIPFQLSGIAWHCLEVYEADKHYYDSYIPTEMLGASNDFYNFISDNYVILSKCKDVSLSQGWKLYSEYCEDAKIPYPLTKRAFRDEFKNYFSDFKDRHTLPDGTRARSYYVGFLEDKFSCAETKEVTVAELPIDNFLNMTSDVSIFDTLRSECPAQLTNEEGHPQYKWDNVKTKLSDIDTKQLHFVRIPENHIVIDFDIPDENGGKSLEKNMEAASKWPKTYAELSKSGKGIHLHYIYSGDPDKLSRLYDDHIEVKVFTGKSSLRRKLTKCNDLEIATISSGLPLREERRKMVGETVIKNDKILRTMILRNLKKEYHDSTKSSIDFINKLLNDAYDGGISYDVSDLRPSIMSFAMNSTNQANNCLKIVNQMKFKSEKEAEFVDSDRDAIVFYDVEVFPNLFLVNWKFQGEGKTVRRMINPSPSAIEELTQFRLVGFNNRRYDNHILYARMLGYSNEQLFELSQRIVNGSPNALFTSAYNLSYTDVYDFASAPNKKSLKKWEIELGLVHHELGLPWDQPVPEEKWLQVAEYCDDDVLATEAVFNHLMADWDTRIILADIAGKSVNDSTNSLATAIVFGNNKKPQNEFNYRDLSKKEIYYSQESLDYIYKHTSIEPNFVAWNGEVGKLPFFPGYTHENGKSIYRGCEVGEGGYVETIPGIHENVALLDVASMHPHSTISECLFGPRYTNNYHDLVRGRIAIKHKDFDTGRKILHGKFAKYIVDDKKKLKTLSTALKTPINSSYGLTAASFENPFRDNRNVDNIVAKRGALFMVDLKYAVEEKGFTVAHIKTDSIKIPNATKEIIDFVMDFGKKYGYEFEHEATYEKLFLKDKAVYIAKQLDPDKCMELYGYVPDNNKDKGVCWTATGTQFAVPYVFKTLFSKESIEIEDMREVKESKKGAIFLNFNESGEDNYKFVGKVGEFTPVKEGFNGGLCVRENVDKDGNLKYDSIQGTKGYRWVISDTISSNDINIIDRSYYDCMVNDALDVISKYCDPQWFIS